MSGEPGRSRRCRLYLKPRRCKARRTVISGPVFAGADAPHDPAASLGGDAVHHGQSSGDRRAERPVGCASRRRRLEAVWTATDERTCRMRLSEASSIGWSVNPASTALYGWVWAPSSLAWPARPERRSPAAESAGLWGAAVGALFPCGQFLGRERFEEAVVKRDAAMESAEGASAPRRYGDELRDRLAIAGDQDFFAALDRRRASARGRPSPG